MNADRKRLDAISERVIGCAFTVANTVRAETERTSTDLDSLKAYYLATGAIDRVALSLTAVNRATAVGVTDAIGIHGRLQRHCWLHNAGWVHVQVDLHADARDAHRLHRQ